jgi:hypothetical protein
MLKFGHILSGDPTIFEPNGAGTYPRVKIQRFDDYQPGRSILAHYAVEIIDAAGASPQKSELRTWHHVEARMDEIYGDKWRKRSSLPNNAR